MKVSLQVEISPFQVPSDVLVVASPLGDTPDQNFMTRIKLSSLDEDTLLRLCEEFKTGVFAMAGKKLPTTIRPSKFPL